MTPEKQKKITAKRIVYYCLIGIFSLVFIGSALFIANYMINSAQNNELYTDAEQVGGFYATLPDLLDPSAPPATDPPATGETPEPTDPPVILEELQAWYDQNNDLVGWIYIPGTKVNYPVYQTPSEPNFYLYRDRYKNHSDWGSIYVREECDVNKPSDNITLYGHRMKDGSMFAALKNYQYRNFYNRNTYFVFSTLYERHVYQIIACFKTTANVETGFMYHQFDNAADEEEFNQFIATVKQMAFYETGVTAEYGDKLITLSTCEYSLIEGRLVVVAKRIN